MGAANGAGLSQSLDPSLPQTGPAFFIDRFGKEDPLFLQMGPATCRASRTWEPINELRMVARWKLGRALTKVERGQSAGSDPTSSDEQTKFSFR